MYILEVGIHQSYVKYRKSKAQSNESTPFYVIQLVKDRASRL